MGKYTEDTARKRGNNPKWLEGRLRNVRDVLRVELREGFGRGRFNFQERTLQGDNGVVLQWQLREEEDKPESYNNQQTTTGFVAVYRTHGQRIGRR